jgi:Dolichol kinase
MSAPLSTSPSSVEIHRELERKALHLPGLLVPWIYQHFPKVTVLGLGLISLVYYLSELRRVSHKSTLPLFGFLSKKLTRTSHLDFAPIFLAVGLCVASVFLPFKAAFSGALLACLCDAIAALVGMQFGRKRIFLTKKTYLGTLAFFLTATLSLLFILPWHGALLTALAASAIEAFSIEGIDNLLLPILGGMLAGLFL